MAVTAEAGAGSKRYYGLAADTKPTSNVTRGSVFYATDTGVIWIYDGSAWSETTAIPSLLALEMGTL